MTLAAEQCVAVRDNIINRFDLQEEGAPYLPLAAAMNGASVGAVRVFRGGPVHKLVYISMTVPFIGLDSHMVYAFTAPDSPVPHFTLDSVCNGDTFAFHLDLTPRVDLGANLNYINAVHQPLTELYTAARSIEGLTPANIAPRQYAVMSPWMLVYRATEDAYRNMRGTIEGYLNHWFTLAENGVAADAVTGIDGATLAERDRINRAIVFSPEVDPVWAQVDRLVGADIAAKMRSVMTTQ